jgi:MFS family permease
MSGPTPPGLRVPLARRDFRLVWLAQAISDLGDGLTSLTLLLLAMQLTGSVAAVAATLVALELPVVTIGLASGVMVDRWERRRVMIVSDLLRAVGVLGFVLVASADRLWLLFVLAFVQATVGTFFSPARTAFVASILPAEELLPANALSQLTRVLAMVLGGAAAGVLVGLTGQFAPAFVFDALTFLASVVLVSMVGARSQPVRSDRHGHGLASIGFELREGLGLIAGTPILLGTMLSMAAAMLGIGAVNVLWLPLFRDELHVPTALFGTADLAEAAAMILGSWLAARLIGRLGATRLITLGIGALGVFVAGFAAVQNYFQVMAFLFVLGLIVAPVHTAIATIIQVAVRDELRGRTAAALGTVTSTSTIVSMGLAGTVASGIGVRNSLALAGAAILGGSVVAYLLFRRVRDEDRRSIIPGAAEYAADA